MKIEEKIRVHLKSYKALHGKTQKEMAEIIGVSYATYQALENGIVKTLDVLNKLKATTGFNEKNVYNSGFAGEEIIKLKKEVIELRAFINIIFSVLSGLSAKAEKKKLEKRSGELQTLIDDEYDRLYKKYLKEQERDQGV